MTPPLAHNATMKGRVVVSWGSGGVMGKRMTHEQVLVSWATAGVMGKCWRHGQGVASWASGGLMGLYITRLKDVSAGC